MNAIEQMATMLLNTWAKKPLEELRIDAEREASGIAFESFRADGGQRFMIVLVATDVEQIALLEKAFELVDDGIVEDWNEITLADLAFRVMRKRGGLRFESLRDEYGRRSALALIAAEPGSVRLIETFFKMPA